MVQRPIRLWCTAFVLAGMLAACSATTPQPPPANQATPITATQIPASTLAATAIPQPTQPPASEVPATPSMTPEALEPTAIAATATPIPTENPTELAATAIPTAAPFPASGGNVVLQLATGSAEGQVGTAPNPGDPNLIIGPSSFRIGSDNSIRVLDRVNKRVLFFEPDGKLVRSQPVVEANDPIDFIVNNQGEMFVYDFGSALQSGGFANDKRIIRYNPAGAVIAQYPIHPEVFGDAVMLTATQDLLIVGGSFGDNARAFTIFHDGKPVDPSHQTLTLKRGMPSPRSAVLFSTADHDGGTTDLSIGVLTGESGPILSNLPVPAGARFLNVDRAMNLYFMKLDDDGRRLHLWDVDTSGALAGGATVDFSNCDVYDWRSVYVAQDGALWTMCTTRSGTTITRFDFENTEGQPLPQAAAQPPDGVPWGAGGPNVAA